MLSRPHKPERDAQIAAFKARGLSVVHISKRMGIAVSTVYQRLKFMEQNGTPKVDFPDLDEPEPESESLPAELEGVDPMELDFAALAILDREVVAYRKEARRRSDVRSYRELAKLQLDVRVAMNKVRPPPKIDPEAAALAAEGKRILLARVDRLLEKVRR